MIMSREENPLWLSTKDLLASFGIRKRPANCILFVWTGFPFEFSSFSDGPAVLGV